MKKVVRSALTLLSVGGRNRDGRVMCRVKCVCGKRKRIQLRYLLNFHTKSCGCAKKRIYPTWSVKHGHRPRGYKSPEYISFQSMHLRCGNPKYPAYLNIRVCDRWSGPKGFINFLADCGKRKPGYTIGRMGDSGNYEPDNAWFMSPEDQKQHKAIKRQFIRNTLATLSNGFGKKKNSKQRNKA